MKINLFKRIRKAVFPTWEEMLNEKTIDWTRLDRLSKSWTSCAVSEVSRGSNGLGPYDYILKVLGIDFTIAIRNRDKKQALLLIDKIKQRKTFLLHIKKGLLLKCPKRY
jgi:hypothetical protein